MEDISLTGYIAIYGAILSSITLFTKLYELWKSRDNIISTSFEFTSRPDKGNLIQIHNLSPNPLEIVGWKLYVRDHFNWIKPFRKRNQLAIDSNDAFPQRGITQTIIGHDKFPILLKDHNFTNWCGMNRKKQSLMMTIKLLGKNQITKKIQ